MGSLFYGSSRVELVIDDETLALVQRVIIAKLRRSEPFAITWHDPGMGGSDSVWVSATVELHFHYDNAPPTEVDSRRLEAITQDAAGPFGLRLSGSVSRVREAS